MSSENLDTQNRILKATVDLLESGEAQKVRMSDIAKRAGISRQALYLHFPTRAELLIATTFYVDTLYGIDALLAPSRAAASGVERLDAFIEAWASYVPNMYGVAKALMAMSATDEAAATAWEQRMQDMREGCEVAIAALKRDENLSSDYPAKQATDILWAMLSVRNWEQWTQDCGWSQKKYKATIKTMARRLFIVSGEGV